MDGAGEERHGVWFSLAARHVGMQDFSSPDQESNRNPCPLQWKGRVLITEQPGKCLGSGLGVIIPDSSRDWLLTSWEECVPTAFRAHKLTWGTLRWRKG